MAAGPHQVPFECILALDLGVVAWTRPLEDMARRRGVPLLRVWEVTDLPLTLPGAVHLIQVRFSQDRFDDAIESVARLRETAQCPIVAVAESWSSDDELRLLGAGADVVVGAAGVTPEFFLELARKPDRLQFGSLKLDLTRFEAWQGKERLHLSPTEFRLLEALTRSAGTVVSASE